MNTLNTRIGRIEERLPRPTRPGKVVRIVASAGDEEAARELAQQQGLDLGPNSNDLVIIRLITPATGQSARSRPPYVQSASAR